MQRNVDSIICTWVDQNFLLKCCYLHSARKPTPTLPPLPQFVNATILHMIEHVVGVTFSLDATLSDHSTRKQEGCLACSTITSIPILMHNHFWNSYLTTVWSHLECSSSVSDFLETVSYILIKTKCAEMCTYFAFCDWNIYLFNYPFCLKFC